MGLLSMTYIIGTTSSVAVDSSWDRPCAGARDEFIPNTLAFYQKAEAQNWGNVAGNVQSI